MANKARYVKIVTSPTRPQRRSEFMNTEIQNKIEELHAALQSHAPETWVGFYVFFNCEGSQVEITTRTAEQLKKTGISIRNLKGDFIK